MPELEQPSSKPTTTAEQDRRTAGQRRVNMTWEYTQAAIALLVIGMFVFTSFREKTVEPFSAGIVGVVIGFYFGRTNHARIGDDPTPHGRLDDR